VDYEFRWNDWNRDHATRHGVSEQEAEWIVRHGQRQRIGHDKYKVVGRDRRQRLIQVIYVIGDDDMVYIIHARPLTDREKRRERRRS
jgi:uncharacterized DUF497 family protein